MNKRKVEIYKEIYNDERSEIKKTSEKGSALITILSFLTFLFLYEVRTYDIASLLPIQENCIFWLFFSLAIIFIFTFIFYLAKLLFGKGHAHLPRNDKLDKDINNINKYYEDEYFSGLSEEEKKIEIEKDFDNLFIRYYKKANVINRGKSIRKSKDYLKSVAYGLSAVVIVIVLSIVHLFIR